MKFDGLWKWKDWCSWQKARHWSVPKWMVIGLKICVGFFLFWCMHFLWEHVSMIVSDIRNVNSGKKGASLGSGGFLGGFPNHSWGTGVTLTLLIETIGGAKNSISKRRTTWSNLMQMASLTKLRISCCHLSKKSSLHLGAWKMQRKHCHWVSEHAQGRCWLGVDHEMACRPHD